MKQELELLEKIYSQVCDGAMNLLITTENSIALAYLQKNKLIKGDLSIHTPNCLYVNLTAKGKNFLRTHRGQF